MNKKAIIITCSIILLLITFLVFLDYNYPRKMAYFCNAVIWIPEPDDVTVYYEDIGIDQNYYEKYSYSQKKFNSFLKNKRVKKINEKFINDFINKHILVEDSFYGIFNEDAVKKNINKEILTNTNNYYMLIEFKVEGNEIFPPSHEREFMLFILDTATNDVYVFVEI